MGLSLSEREREHETRNERYRFTKPVTQEIGKRWENIPVDGLTVDDLNQAIIESFIEKAVQKERIPDDAKSTDTAVLLKNLNFFTD